MALSPLLIPLTYPAHNSHTATPRIHFSEDVSPSGWPTTKRPRRCSSEIVESEIEILWGGTSALLHFEQRSHRFHSIPQIPQAQVLIRGVLIVIVVGDGYRDGASVRGALHRAQRDAPSHGR